MKVGVALPGAVADVWADDDTLERWSRAIDAGPFASLSFGSRIAGDTPEVIALAGAVSAWTERVTVRCALTPQLYGTIWLAKSLMTLDRLSHGRLEVVLGVGAREEDYRALVVDQATQTVQQVEARARRMRWVWGGDHFADTVRPVGPPPARAGGPGLLMSTFGEQAARSAAGWADGVLHSVLGDGELELDELERIFGAAREAWAVEGRTPRLVASTWFAVDDRAPGRAREQMSEHLRDYIDWTTPTFLAELLPRAGMVGTAVGIADGLRRFEDLGIDELNLMPTSVDLAQLDVLAEAVEKTGG